MRDRRLAAAMAGAHGQPSRSLFFTRRRPSRSQGPEGAGLVWDLQAVRVSPPGEPPPPATLWELLAAPDAQQAHHAATHLLRDKQATSLYFANGCAQLRRSTRSKFNDWIKDLNSERFPVRDVGCARWKNTSIKRRRRCEPRGANHHLWNGTAARSNP